MEFFHMISNTYERITAAVILAVSLYLLYVSQAYPLESRIFPIGVLGLMAVLSVVVIIRTFFRQPADDESSEEEPAEKTQTFFIHRNRFLAAFGCILGYIILLPILGYFTSSAIFFIVLTLSLGYRHWKLLFLTVGLFLGFVYIVFIKLFERPIPPEFFQIH